MSQKKTRHIIQGYSSDGCVITINKETMKFYWIPTRNVPKDNAREFVGYCNEGATIRDQDQLRSLLDAIVTRILF